jgi:hypothetical protein
VELAEGVKMMTTKYEAYLVDKTFELPSQLAAKDVEIVQLRRELAEARGMIENMVTLQRDNGWGSGPDCECAFCAAQRYLAAKKD